MMLCIKPFHTVMKSGYSMKITKKILSEYANYNKGQPKSTRLTVEQYIDYVYRGKGLPGPPLKSSNKSFEFKGIPSWAVDHKDIKSVESGTYIAIKNSIIERSIKESDSVRKEIIRKKNSIAIPYSKGAYQYISDTDLTTCLGRKL